MQNIKILDCTLRDGGYVNQWNFSQKQARDTIHGLIKANIDIIECGFLDQKNTYPYWSTRFHNLEEINQLFSNIKKENSLVVAMIEYGKYDLNMLPKYQSASIVDGIRFSFRKSDWQDSLSEMKKIIEKGYKLFVQPITTNSYEKDELNHLLAEVEALSPYAVYIVDTQGSMFGKDMLELFQIFDLALPKDIAIGFHSHNNMQLSYSNAIDFVSQSTCRNLIVDSSIYGMGRGAGNLNTELFATYLNRLKKKYDVDVLWNLIDTYYHAMHSMYQWGYSIFHYLSASLGCHPDYASYLLDKKHLLIEDIKKILEKIPKEYSYEFNRKIIEDLYFSSNNHTSIKIREPILGNQQKIVLIGSGKNIQSEIENIKKENAILISLNHIPKDLKVDYVFFNSVKRFLSTSKDMLEGIGKIFTSNIEKEATRDDYVLDYQELTTIDEQIRNDNSVIMLINYLYKRGFTSVSLAGIDGFESNVNENYAYHELDRVVDKKALEDMNTEIKKCLDAFENKIAIKFLTKSIFCQD